MTSWQTQASLATLRARAQLLAAIRQFFANRDVLEVQTPVLSRHTVTDVHTDSFSVPDKESNYFLQTSPEYAMKRLLACQSGAIYQIAPVFRYAEEGSKHNPEFTLLEWYRPGFDQHDLIKEIDELLQSLFTVESAEKLSYQTVWLQHINVDPLDASLSQLQQFIQQHINSQSLPSDRDTCMQLIMSHIIEPKLGVERPLFVYDFPASQAALAALSLTDRRVAERFELFINGIELANGFHELTDATLQHQRFIEDQVRRRELGLMVPEIDERLLDALAHGLPNCAGVAMGIERLLMVQLGLTHINEAMSFAWPRA